MNTNDARQAVKNTLFKSWLQFLLNTTLQNILNWKSVTHTPVFPKDIYTGACIVRRSREDASGIYEEIYLVVDRRNSFVAGCKISVTELVCGYNILVTKFSIEKNTSHRENYASLIITGENKNGDKWEKNIKKRLYLELGY